MYYMTEYLSPIGKLTLACDIDGKNLVGLWMEGQKYHGSSLHKAMISNNNILLFDIVKNWLDRYFDGKNPDINELTLLPKGSEFRKKVWDILREIPYGKVITYGDIAKKVAKQMGKESMSSQAVGGAVGHNPISIIIPCHRVVGTNGSLTGFSAGIKTKIKLLELEGVDVSAFFIPQKSTAP